MYLADRLGIIYHQTLNRTKFNNIIKYIFYNCLYFHQRGLPINVIDNCDLDYLLTLKSVDEILDIFYHSKIELIGIPQNKILQPINVMVSLEKYKCNHYDGFFKNDTLCLKNVPYYCYLDVNKCDKLRFTFEEVVKIKIDLYTIHQNEKYNINTYLLKVENNMVTINYNFSKKSDNSIIVAMLNCIESTNNNVFYKILNFKYHCII